MADYFTSLVLTTLMGGMLRLLMLRSDYRQYPTYPHGYVSHLSLGFIAPPWGSGLACPPGGRIRRRDLPLLAAQQFRDIRNIERRPSPAWMPTSWCPGARSS